VDIKKRQNASPVSIAASMANLARLLAQPDKIEAEKLASQAVELLRSVPKPPPYEFANALITLGQVQLNLRKLESARKTSEDAVRAAREGLGERHPVYAAALALRAMVSRTMGDAQAAERGFNEALAVAEKILGSRHPDLVPTLNSLAGLYVEKGDFSLAATAYRRVVEIQERYLTDVLLTGSEASRAESLSGVRSEVATLIAFQETVGTSIPDARTLAFETVAARKARMPAACAMSS
jgi:tetratricopeptide (TPR) repeat protein